MNERYAAVLAMPWDEMLLALAEAEAEEAEGERGEARTNALLEALLRSL